MRPIAASESCNTLVDVNEYDSHNKLDHNHHHDIQLPSSNDFYVGDSSSDDYYLEETRLMLPSSTTSSSSSSLKNSNPAKESSSLSQCYLSLPLPSSPSWVMDRHLSSISAIVDTAEHVVSQPPVRYLPQHQQKSDILYVYQREVAHMTSGNESGINTLVSDMATTCHVFAIHSTCGNGKQTNHSSPLASLAHIDDTKYESCIRQMVQTHIDHHQSNNNNNNKDLISMSFHVVGGFQEDTSRDITSWLLHLLASLSQEYSSQVGMTLATCAVSSINHNYSKNGPIGRGLAIDVTTGDVNLAKVVDIFSCPQNIPAMSLRSCRLWSDDRTKTHKLAVVTSCMSSTSVPTITIHPFRYAPFPDMDILEQLPDEIFLEYTSTSPDCEEPEFCNNARATMKYLRTTRPSSSFGSSLDTSLVYEYDKSTKEWNQTVITKKLDQDTKPPTEISN